MYVTEKLDGSCCCVARQDGQIIPLTRTGYLASESRMDAHRGFADWVYERQWLFMKILEDDERLAGEWMAQAHGTVYESLTDLFYVFDLLRGTERVPFDECVERAGLRTADGSGRILGAGTTVD